MFYLACGASFTVWFRSKERLVEKYETANLSLRQTGDEEINKRIKQIA